MTKFWVDDAGMLLRATDDSVEDVAGAVGFTDGNNPPDDGNQVLVAGVWTTIVTAEMVKAEAGRRIVEIVPEWKQRNLTARGTKFALRLAQGDTLSVADQAELAAGEAIWAQVEAIRDASDLIEAMDPIPADYADNKHW